MDNASDKIKSKEAEAPQNEKNHVEEAPTNSPASDPSHAIASGKTSKLSKGSKDQPPADPLKEIEAKFLTAKKECEENYDRLLRTSAEFENYKKRTTREIKEFRKYANEELIKEMLPILDNLERALESSEESEKTDDGVVEGVGMTLKEILKVLKKYGVVQIESLGNPFDPNYHQAVMQEETDEAVENIVLKEFQKGYMMHDRLIRPAMVVVSKAKSKIVAIKTDEVDENSDQQEAPEAIKD